MRSQSSDFRIQNGFEFQLKHLVLQYNIKISTKEMSEAIGISRQRLTALLRGKDVQGVQLSMLGKLCDWLETQGVPHEELPGSLFAPRRLSAALARSVHVPVFVAQFSSTELGSPEHWVSPNDTKVFGDLVNYMVRNNPENSPELVAVTADDPDAVGIDEEQLSGNNARSLFSRYRQMELAVNIYVGSHLSNKMCEHLIADIAGVEPYVYSSTIPFYFRSGERRGKNYGRSCCAGESIDDNFQEEGIYIKSENRLTYDEQGRLVLQHDNEGSAAVTGGWERAQYVEGVRSCGVIVTRYNRTRSTFYIALMGFDGQATLSLGRFITEADNIDRFWPLESLKNGGAEEEESVGAWLVQLDYQTMPVNEKEVSSYVNQIVPICFNRQGLVDEEVRDG